MDCNMEQKHQSCTQACHLREQQSVRELQKLRESFMTLKLETDKEIAYLKQQLVGAYGESSMAPKTARLVATSPFRSPPLTQKKSPVTPLEHALVPTIYSITDTGVKLSGRIDRLGSHNSSQVLAALCPLPAPAGDGVEVARRVVAALANPRMAMLPYLRSLQFAADLVGLSAQVGLLLEREARCLALKSPVYVFGDVHGNWTDLHFFAEHMWPLGLEVTAGSFLFLGDYVDRGNESLECAAYLFAHKLLHPDKLFLLRGNHETRAVNGLETLYGSGCLLAQCKARFGSEEGIVVWHQLNNAFDRLPVAAVIDNDVFCVHGGIPRPPERNENTLEAIAKLPTAVPLDALESSYYDGQPQLSMVADMIWGDPVRGEGTGQDQGANLLDPRGFGKSPRGGVAVCYSSRAVEEFLTQNRFSRILRAHEAALAGLSFSNAARVVTVFSTSKDHGLGDNASCGCVLVDKQHLRFLNRSSDFGRQQQQQQQEYRYRRRSGSGAFSLGFSDRLPMQTSMSSGSTASTGRRPGRAASTDSVRLVDCVRGVRRLVAFTGAAGGSTSARAGADCDGGDTDDEGEQQCEDSMDAGRERIVGVNSRSSGMTLALPPGFVARHRRQSDSSDQQDNNQADDL